MIHFLSTSFSSQFCFYAFSFSLFLSSKWLFLKSSLLFHSYSNSPDEMNDMVDRNNFVYCNRRMNTLSTSLRPQMFLNHWSRYNLFSENCEAIQSLYYHLGPYKRDNILLKVFKEKSGGRFANFLQNLCKIGDANA